MGLELLETLRRLVGDDGLLRQEEIDGRYCKEYFSTEPEDVRPLCVVRPRTTEQVSAVLQACHAGNQPVVLQGGMTGLSGGALPRDGEVILSLERMRGIEELDEQAGTMTLRAGTPLQEAQEAAAEKGFLLAIDLGARGSCHIAGNIATNAGGNRVIRYGMTRQQVLGLEVVLADGTIISSLNKMLKNNAGYDLKHLFIGTEGTLGVITRAVIRLEPLPNCVQTALCATGSYAQVVALLQHARQRLAGRLSAFEVMWNDFYRLATRIAAQRPPLPEGESFYVLLDMQGADAEADAQVFEQMLEEALESGLITDAALARSEAETQRFWRLRDTPGEFTSVWPILSSFDVSLPIGQIGEFVERLSARLDQQFPGCEYVNFGHIGDSNLHVCIHLPGATAEDFPEGDIKACLYGLLRDYGGSISAEHGVGTQKAAYLPYSRSAEEIALMRTLKSALDPRGILNPGRVFS